MFNAALSIVHVPDVVIVVSPEHRVFRGSSRFYSTVRNILYSAYKIGAAPQRLLVSAAQLLRRAMCREFLASSEE
ncbi:MAG TPA: hypothetical protein VLC92_20885 [Rhodocyclaceae bacterium]|nr:hypothetical protein [Rhodocyclaceae bacterium]